MFLDLSGSTGVAEALGPERSRDLLSAMQTLVEGEVTAHGGVVITYMGDGVLAVFGLPKPRKDDAAQALATVEALHESMTAWLVNLPPAARERLDFRIGLHFGPAILSRLGSPTQQQITATGDTVNVASRLLEVAKQQHCRVVVTEDLFQAANAPTAPANDTAGYAPLTVSIRGRASDLASSHPKLTRRSRDRISVQLSVDICAASRSRQMLRLTRRMGTYRIAGSWRPPA